LVKINYPGTGNNTQITYDGLGHWVKIEERTGEKERARLVPVQVPDTAQFKNASSLS